MASHQYSYFHSLLPVENVNIMKIGVVVVKSEDIVYVLTKKYKNLQTII